MPCRRGERKQRRRDRVVVRDAAPVRIHPSQAELRLRISGASSGAVQRRRLERLLRHAFTILVRPGLRDQDRRRGYGTGVCNIPIGNTVGCIRSGSECKSDKRKSSDAETARARSPGAP